MRHWNDETDREAAQLYGTFTETKIRRYQDLAAQQMETAWAQRNEDALADLQAMSDALVREMIRRTVTKVQRP